MRSIIRRCCCRGYSSRNISYNEMLELMKNNPVVIIDVRSKQEFAEGHFDGAINIPLCDIKSSIGNIVPNKNQIIILYCSEGIRSMKAKKILDSMGYSRTYNWGRGKILSLKSKAYNLKHYLKVKHAHILNFPIK